MSHKTRTHAPLSASSLALPLCANLIIATFSQAQRLSDLLASLFSSPSFNSFELSNHQEGAFTHMHTHLHQTVSWYHFLRHHSLLRELSVCGSIRVGKQLHWILPTSSPKFGWINLHRRLLHRKYIDRRHHTERESKPATLPSVSRNIGQGLLGQLIIILG